MISSGPFQSQEGDCGLQKSHRAPGWYGGAVDILLRGSTRLFGILQYGGRKILCRFDPHVWTVAGNRI
jgi:hypothetical protein